MIECSSCRAAGGRGCLASSKMEESWSPLLKGSGLAGGRRSSRLDAGSFPSKPASARVIRIKRRFLLNGRFDKEHEQRPEQGSRERKVCLGKWISRAGVTGLETTLRSLLCLVR